MRSASRPPTHLCVFPAEIKVLPESLRAEGCGPPAAAGARAVSSSRGWGQGLSGAGNAGAAPRRVLGQPARPPGSVRPGVGGGGGRLEPSGENRKWGPWKESCGQHGGCPPLSLPSVLGRGWAGSRNPPPSFPSRVRPWRVVGPWALEMVAEHVRMGLGWVLKCVEETSVNTLVQARIKQLFCL